MSEHMKKKIAVAKRRLLEMHFNAKIGHIGGNLSCLDTLLVLHHNIIKDQDTFILSKGHSAGALYIALWSIGKLSDEDLHTFHRDNTKLAGHPMCGWLPEIPIATGSLGHGFPVAVGLALGRTLAKQPGHVYCLTSDGEWQEGSNWEALIFLAHRQLPNLTLLIDCNGLQGFGNTKDVASMHDLKHKLEAFNLSLTEINGHDPAAIANALEKNEHRIILLNTTKGAGVSFMENRMEWHYLPLKDTEFTTALEEIDAT